MSNSTRILSTMPLDRTLTDGAAAQGVTLDVLPFIEVTPKADRKLKDRIMELCQVQVTAVFTSINAVKAIADIIFSADPQWNIYCIGNATMHAVLDSFDSAVVKGTANDAATLAKVIIEDVEDNVVLFCGDRRLDTLPNALRTHDIEVYEMIVYSTTETPHKIDAAYDAILFYSPSGVDSFFSANTIGEETVLFAIGNTTADTVKKHSSNKVIVSETATKEMVLNYAIKYFDK